MRRGPLYPVHTTLFTPPPSCALGPERTGGVGVGLMLEGIRWSKMMARDRHLKWHRGRYPRFWVQNCEHSQPDTEKQPCWPRNQDSTNRAVGTWDSCQLCDPIARQITAVLCTSQGLNFVMPPSLEGSEKWGKSLLKERASFIRWLVFPFFCVRLDWSEMVKYFSAFCFLKTNKKPKTSSKGGPIIGLNSWTAKWVT